LPARQGFEIRVGKFVEHIRPDEPDRLIGCRRFQQVIDYFNEAIVEIRVRIAEAFVGLLEQRVEALIEIDDRVDHIVKLLEIGEFAERRTKGFSQGQRTKVSLARALVHDPQNIILDEPSNGLDVMATRSLRELILKLRDDGRCVLFSSHVMQEVAALCDDICIIAHGRVAIDDSIDGIRQRTGCDDIEDAFVEAIHMVEPE